MGMSQAVRSVGTKPFASNLDRGGGTAEHDRRDSTAKQLVMETSKPTILPFFPLEAANG
jgi:hypothetical protein